MIVPFCLIEIYIIAQICVHTHTLLVVRQFTTKASTYKYRYFLGFRQKGNSSKINLSMFLS